MEIQDSVLLLLKIKILENIKNLSSCYFFPSPEGKILLFCTFSLLLVNRKVTSLKVCPISLKVE